MANNRNCGISFRSEKMSRIQLFLQHDAAYACIAEFGEIGLIEFSDLNLSVNEFQRKYINEVRRCDEMERKLRYVEKEAQKCIPEEIRDMGEDPETPMPSEMFDLELQFERLDDELREANSNKETLSKNKLELMELLQILRETQGFFADAEIALNPAPQGSEEGHTDPGVDALSPKFGFITGVISRERLASFERMLWRACRGNVFLRQAAIDLPLVDPVSGEVVDKCVFVIFFQGEQLRTKVKKICEGYKATMYPCPDSQSERKDMAAGVLTRIEDIQTVLSQTEEHQRRILSGAARNIRVWFAKVRKIKAVYHVLNLCNIQKAIVAEGWCPSNDIDLVHGAARRGTERSGTDIPAIINTMETTKTPPTYHKTNKFTYAFQAIVDAYGVADYREINPAPYAIITFPFLFAVMFGDFGHGLIMFLFALWMILNEKRFNAEKGASEIWLTIYGGRYIILLMGLFSIYTGFLYNDAFSKSVNIFGSSWSLENTFTDMNVTANTILTTPTIQLNPIYTYTPNSPYPLGVDPVWNLSKNKISFMNSYKMKLSVILGVAQMMFGVFLSLANHSYFNNKINILAEFIPQVIFLTSIMGYLCVMIVIKWIKFDASVSAVAPSLLITLIDMFLLKAHPHDLYAGQWYVEKILLVVAVLCIPWMLLLKPLVIRAQHRRSRLVRGIYTPQCADTTPVLAEDHQPDSGDDLEISFKDDTAVEEEFDFGDIFIHQCIHTIEFCLGCISHTASYLRLWALSLAHSELSEVLWNMAFRIGLASSSYLGAALCFVIFAAWAVGTVVILLVMEALSAFLHTLRLHWVEFQSKFYSGNGNRFQPFSFVDILQSADD